MCVCVCEREREREREQGLTVCVCERDTLEREQGLTVCVCDAGARAGSDRVCVCQWKVRRTLAFSIHELALILGDQLTAAHLVPIFNSFLKDLDEVRIGVLKHLYDFLKVSDTDSTPLTETCVFSSLF